VYINVNFNVFKLIKVHLLVSELYIKKFIYIILKRKGLFDNCEYRETL